jgi:hypothetical protein
MSWGLHTPRALEYLVHQECRRDQGLEDGEQILAKRVGLLPEEHQRTDQAQAVDGVAPMPGWGPVHETYGVDPYLVTAMSVAFTLGEGVRATAKHFLGYAVTDGSETSRRPRSFRASSMMCTPVPFEAAIRLAGLGSVMASYSEYDGVPIHTSHELLTPDCCAVGWVSPARSCPTMSVSAGPTRASGSRPAPRK